MSETMQRHMAPMPAWLVFSGATIGIVGAIVTKHAESVGKLIVAVDGRADPSNLAAAPGEWGPGLLIVGAFVALSGLVLTARRPNPNIIEPEAEQSETPKCPHVDRPSTRCQPGEVRCHVAAAGALRFGLLRNHSHITGDS